MKKTVNTLLSELMRRSRTVWGMDHARLANKAVTEPDEPDYEYGENDIHRLYRYIREITAYGIPELKAVRNFNEPFALQTLSLHRAGRYLDLYSRHCKLDLSDFVSMQYWFLFGASRSTPELEAAFTVIMGIQREYFWSSGLYHAALLDYMSLLAAGQMQYEPECFRSIFLIDISESPADSEAISHFDLRVQAGEVRFIFRDTGETLGEVYRRMCSLSADRQWIQRGFRETAPEALQAIENDFTQILAHF